MYLVSVLKNQEVMVNEDMFFEDRALELLDLMTEAISSKCEYLDTNEDEFGFVTSKYLCDTGAVYEVSYGFSPF